MSELNLIVGTKEIQASIDSIQRRGKKLDESIQLTGLSCLAHIDQHGDVTLFNRLYAAMPQGSRKKALADWGTRFGKLHVNLDAGTKKELPFVYLRDAVTDLEGAIETPWFKCKLEPELGTEFDLDGAIAALLKRVQTAQNKGQTIKSKQGALEALVTLAS